MYKNTIQLGHGRQNKDFLEDIFRVVGRWNNKIAFYLVRREYFRATLYFICILNYVQRYSYFKPLFRPNFSMVINQKNYNTLPLFWKHFLVSFYENGRN
jgi:hypothetical protein